jgi:hypothetical protein
MTAFLILATLVTQTVPIGAQPSPRAGEGVPPAPAGQPCTAPDKLRGSPGVAPKSGDVAVVEQLCAGGVSVASLPHAPIIIPPATTVSTPQLDRGQSLPPLVSLGAPGSAEIDLRSGNGNFTHLFSGALWHAPAINGKGELQSIDSGHASFSVASALGYFAVVMPRFLARVKGTIFDVDYEPGKSASFKVTEGSVAIVRIVTIHLNQENRTIDGIRQTDVITANGKNHIEYALPLGLLLFQNAGQAEQQFEQELQQATVDGDPELVDDALNNIEIVTGKPIGFVGTELARGLGNLGGAGAGAAGSSAGLIAAGLAAAAAGIVIVSTSNHGTTPPVATPTALVTGTATLTSTGRAAASPIPTPSPTPSPSPKPAAAAPPPGPKSH